MERSTHLLQVWKRLIAIWRKSKMGRTVAGQKHVEGGDQRRMDDGGGGEEFGGHWRQVVNNNAFTTFNPTSQHSAV
ncbi:hypothetical protein Ddye_023042 [Dipteronia dyeriana]|uniref:Uncharacterized protein n=1 Tax=Dipteronia dyeriana TaxID=168575 RepID=A0AAD9WRR7_9ROSI|nr:hypothetical protein Ddye_023042 [Dipteronia dyeriana]